MATYNRATTLPRAIDSILAQTIEDIEFVIVDDGSTDSTPELLRKYIDKDNRITVITQKNQGPAIARNNGVAKAAGKYIAIMDSDDACAVNRLELQLDFMVKNSQHSACGLSHLSSIIDYYPGVVATGSDEFRVIHDSPFHNKQLFAVLGPHSFMTRESFIQIGGYRSPRTIVEDLDFTLRYSNHYSWAIVDNRRSYFYNAPSTNPGEGEVNNDVLNYPKRIIACYISEWCRINNMQDPVEQGKSLDEILEIANRIPSKDRAIIYRNIRYFRETLSKIGNMSTKQSKHYLLSILGDNLLDRWMINCWFKFIN